MNAGREPTVPRTYRAMQATRPGVLEWVERETPEPGSGEVLLRVEVCGICGADAGTIEGQRFGFLFVFIGLVLWAGWRHGFGPAVVRGRRQDGAEVALAVAGGMLLLASLLVNVSFWMEVKKARVILCERLERREARPGNRLVRGAPASS